MAPALRMTRSIKEKLPIFLSLFCPLPCFYFSFWCVGWGDRGGGRKVEWVDLEVFFGSGGGGVGLRTECGSWQESAKPVCGLDFAIGRHICTPLRLRVPISLQWESSPANHHVHAFLYAVRLPFLVIFQDKLLPVDMHSNHIHLPEVTPFIIACTMFLVVEEPLSFCFFQVQIFF